MTEEEKFRITQDLKYYYNCEGKTIIDEHSSKVSVYGNCTLIATVDNLIIKFDKIDGNFICSYNKLNNLYGCPEYVNGMFSCIDNKITSLIHGPKKVGESFDCSMNKLISLEGAPKIINGGFSCMDNPLKSLDGIPKIINGPFYINVYPHTPLLKILTVTGITEFYFYNNLTSSMSTMLHVLSDLFKEHYGKKNAILKVGLEMMRLGYGSNARL